MTFEVSEKQAELEALKSMLASKENQFEEA